MFYKLNAVLRNFPEVVVLGCKGNKYTTTINAIVSGLRKLMWFSPMHTVFRGIGNLILPPSLMEPDEYGVRGGTEAGMMSTTTKIETALQYIKGKREPTVFEITLGAVDRAASLAWLSQYPGEKEYLLPPLSSIVSPDYQHHLQSHP